MEIGLSRVHVYRKIKHLTGLSVSEFIRNIKLIASASGSTFYTRMKLWRMMLAYRQVNWNTIFIADNYHLMRDLLYEYF